MKKAHLVLMSLLLILTAAILPGCGSDHSEANIAAVQNGYLGEFTDITVKDLFSGYYTGTMSYDEETWDGGTTDSGKEIVQVTFRDTEGDFKDVNMQFTMLDEQCFEITAFVDPLQSLEKPTDLLAILNLIYFQQYLTEHPDIAGDFEDELAFITEMDSISGSAVKYGAAAEYEGDRSQLCTLTGDTPLDMNVPALLDATGMMDMSYYYQDGNVETVQTGYLGEYIDITVQGLFAQHYSGLYDEETWESQTSESGTKTIQVTYSDSKGSLQPATIQFLMLDDTCFKITSWDDPSKTIGNSTDLLSLLNKAYYDQYVEEYPEAVKDSDRGLAFIKRLENISGSAAQYGASADYNEDRGQICQLFGDFPLDMSVAELLDSSGLLDLAAYYPTPEPTATLAPDPTPEYDSIAWADSFYVGNWSGINGTLTISTTSTPGRYYVEIISNSAAYSTSTWTYDAEMDSSNVLNCYNGTLRIDSKFGSSEEYVGVGTAAIDAIDKNPGRGVLEYICTYEEDNNYNECLGFEKNYN